VVHSPTRGTGPGVVHSPGALPVSGER
jgi:hypothetical protein